MNSGILFGYCVPFVFSAVVLRTAHNLSFHLTIYPHPLTVVTADDDGDNNNCEQRFLFVASRRSNAGLLNVHERNAIACNSRRWY